MLIVIDDNDPVGLSENLYERADLCFVTNKLKNDPKSETAKVLPLFPHYPINNLLTYLRLFFFKVGLKNLLVFLREAVRIWKRSKYLNHTYKERGKNFVFFSGLFGRKNLRQPSQGLNLSSFAKNIRISNLWEDLFQEQMEKIKALKTC